MSWTNLGNLELDRKGQQEQRDRTRGRCLLVRKNCQVGPRDYAGLARPAQERRWMPRFPKLQRGLGQKRRQLEVMASLACEPDAKV